MKIKNRIKSGALAIAEIVNDKFYSQFGFYMQDMNFPKIVDYMHEPKDSSSLAVTRILFGLAMLFDIPNERGGANMEKRWGDPSICHFPLFPFLQAMSMPYMALVYAGLWLGAVGIMLGYKYRISATMFTACYWYLLLIEKSFWNNHSYLFGLVALLLTCTEANCYWSIDAWLDPAKLSTTVPYWNYFILKYQFFILYFMAGMKKGTPEWLSGYAMRNLSEHWVFSPFKFFFTTSQIDYLIVHWFIFVFDLTIAMWMMCSRTRHIAMVFCSLFHLMNSRLFRIGMFPWVCLATLPLFYPFDWPKVILRKHETCLINLKAQIRSRIDNFLADNSCKYVFTAEIEEDDDIGNYDIYTISKINEEIEDDDVFNDSTKIKEEDLVKEKGEDVKNDCSRKKLTLYFIIFHVITQALFPYSHFITQGYNNWINGLYGYSWDMMVHTWHTHAVIVKVIDNDKHSESFVDPYIFTLNSRWVTHGDMVYQYAQCLREKLIANKKNVNRSDNISQNLSIYVDVWTSFNGRITQRHFDSKVDMLRVDWSPLKRPSFIMPLLDESLAWRPKMDEIKKHVETWSNRSDVIFLADFPGYEQEKFISTDLRNVSLTILDGEVGYEPHENKHQVGYSFKFNAGEDVPIDVGTFHKVHNIGEKPTFYMYTFYNSTKFAQENVSLNLPIIEELHMRMVEMLNFFKVLVRNFSNIISGYCNC